MDFLDWLRSKLKVEHKPEYVFIEKYFENEEAYVPIVYSEPNKLQRAINAAVAKLWENKQNGLSFLNCISASYAAFNDVLATPDVEIKTEKIWRVVVQENTVPSERRDMMVKTKDNWEPDLRPGDAIKLVSVNGCLLATNS